MFTNAETKRDGGMLPSNGRETGGQILHHVGFDEGILSAHVGSRHDLNGGGLVPEPQCPDLARFGQVASVEHMENMGRYGCCNHEMPKRHGDVGDVTMFHSDVQ